MAVNLKLFVAQSIGLAIVFALALFLPAGTLAWTAGWVFLALFFAFYLSVETWLIQHNPGLAEERLHWSAANQKGWDKIVFPLLLAFPLLWLAFIAFDAERGHWSPVPLWLQWLGAAILLVSFYIFFLTFRENSYLSPVVRVQSDRGHAVVSTGPYHYVRHPMYTGILLFCLGTPLLLGAWSGVLLGLILVLALARRAVLEERMLLTELQGYDTYKTQVKYRFIPYVW